MVRIAKGLMTLLVLTAATGALAGDTAVLLTTDYTSSATLATLDLETHAALSGGLATHTDASVVTYGDRVYVVNRLGQDNIIVLEASDLSTPVIQYSVGNGTNPYDLGFVSESKAYVPLYEKDYVLVINPTTGDSLGSVDISSVSDADGVPEASRAVVYGGYAFVVCQRVNRDGFFAPTDYSEVVVIDTSTDAVVDVDPDQDGVQGIVLSLKNPQAADQRGDKLYLACVGSWGDLTDGGVEVVDLASRETEGVVLSETAIGGDAASVTMATDSEGYVVLSDASFTSGVVKVDLLTKQVTPVFTEAGGGSIPTMGYLKGRMYVLDRGGWSAPEANVYVYDTSDDSLIAGPISTTIPPAAIAFTGETGASGGGSADFDGDGAVDFNDFLTFAASYGKSQGEAGYDSRSDLNDDGSTDFDDFLLFVAQYGE